jgi:hypothetical protein
MVLLFGILCFMGGDLYSSDKSHMLCSEGSNSSASASTGPDTACAVVRS